MSRGNNQLTENKTNGRQPDGWRVDIMNNTIILLKGEAGLTNATEMKRFGKGHTIWGIDNNPEELKRWNIEQEAEAKEELAKYRCSYHSNGHMTWIKEYALEYCECDEEGEFIQGSDYDLADEESEE